MAEVSYATAADVTREEVEEFVSRVESGASGSKRVGALLDERAAFVAARSGGRLIGMARGIADGHRAYFTDCKLDPSFQGPAAISHSGGRIEDDAFGIAAEMARRVLERLRDEGASRVEVLAWGTEVDFLEDLGFKRQGGLVGLAMDDSSARAAQERSVALVK